MAAIVTGASKITQRSYVVSTPQDAHLTLIGRMSGMPRGAEQLVQTIA